MQSETTSDLHNPAQLISNEPLPLKYLQTLGASTGQVATFDGTTVTWQDIPPPSPSPFTLPQSVTDTSSPSNGNSFVQNYSTIISGVGQYLIGSNITTGIGLRVVLQSNTLTTGRYIQANDGASEVFGIGANGHIHTGRTNIPTVAVSTGGHGITAVSLGTGSSDTSGEIIAVGTQDNTGETVITLTFNKPFSSVIKHVSFVGSSTAATKQALYIPTSGMTTTSFAVHIPAATSATANPSWTYFVVA